MPRRVDYSDLEREPDYEEAIRAFVAANPDSPQAADVRALGGGNGAPKPSAMLADMVTSAAPRRIVGPTLTLGPGGSVGTYDEASPELTPEERAAEGPLSPASPPVESILTRLAKGASNLFTSPELQARMQAGDTSPRLNTALTNLGLRESVSAPPLPDASMPLPGAPPEPAVAPPPRQRTVQVGRAAHVDVPNTAVVQSLDRGPSPGRTPDGGGDRVRQALTALAMSAGPQEQGGLDEALRASADRRLVAGLARAGGTAIGRGAGPGYDALDEAADRPIQEFQARRQLSLEDRQRAALEAAADAARRKEAFGEEMGRADLDIKRQRLQLDRDALKAKRAGAGGAREADIQKLGKDTEGLARIKADVALLEQLAATPEGQDIPGAGVFDTKKPGFMQSPADTEAYQATLRVAAELLHQQSGASVTPQEAERFLESRGMGKGTTEQQFRAGAKALVRDLRAELTAKKAKYRPEVEAALRQRGGVVDLPVGAPTPGAGAPKRVTRTDPATGETRVWNGSAWVKG